MFCQTFAVNAMRSLKALQKWCSNEESAGTGCPAPGAAAANKIRCGDRTLSLEPNRIAKENQAPSPSDTAPVIRLFPWESSEENSGSIVFCKFRVFVCSRAATGETENFSPIPQSSPVRITPVLYQ